MQHLQGELSCQPRCLHALHALLASVFGLDLLFPPAIPPRVQNYTRTYDAASVLVTHHAQELRAALLLYAALVQVATPRQMAHMMVACQPNRPDPVQISKLLLEFDVARATFHAAASGDSGHLLPLA